MTVTATTRYTRHALLGLLLCHWATAAASSAVFSVQAVPSVHVHVQQRPAPVACKVRADKKHTHTPEVKTINKTVFFFALEKNHLPLQCSLQGVAEVHVEDI
jgi:hypothetical protein